RFEKRAGGAADDVFQLLPAHRFVENEVEIAPAPRVFGNRNVRRVKFGNGLEYRQVDFSGCHGVVQVEFLTDVVGNLSQPAESLAADQKLPPGAGNELRTVDGPGRHRHLPASPLQQ